VSSGGPHGFDARKLTHFGIGSTSQPARGDRKNPESRAYRFRVYVEPRPQAAALPDHFEIIDELAQLLRSGTDRSTSVMRRLICSAPRRRHPAAYRRAPS
jgi:hypothetical protein